jgi:WD40 repeat protein
VVWLRLSNARHCTCSVRLAAAPTFISAHLMQAVKARSSHTDWITAIAWHPQSAHHLATASQDCTVKLWDTRAAVPLHTITGHTDKVIVIRL